MNGNAGGSAVALKLQNLNRRVVAVVLAITMVVSLLAVGATWFSAKADNKTFVEMNGVTSNAPVTLNNTYQPDTYYFTFTPENRTYSYQLDTTLVPGDTLQLDPATKVITYTHTPATEGTAVIGYANVAESADPNEEGVYYIEVNSDKTLNPDTTYFFEVGENEDKKFYMFSFDRENNDVLGYVAGDPVDSEWSTRENANDKQRDNVVIRYDTATKVAEFTEDSYTLRRNTVYEEASTLTPNEVYLITGVSGSEEKLLQYATSASSTKLANDYGGSSTAYTYYPVSTQTVVPVDTVNDGDNVLEGKFIVSDSGDFNAFKNSEFIARDAGSTFQNNCFLYGTTTAGNITTYTNAKTLTNPYDGNSTVYVCNTVGQTSKGGFIGFGTKYFDDRLGAAWAYSPGTINNLNGTTYSTSGIGGHTYESNGKGSYLKFYNNAFVVGTQNDSSVNLYQRKDVYSKNSIESQISTDEKTITSNSMTPSTVTYDDPSQGSSGSSTVKRGGLEMNKTVTPVAGDDDRFHVTLDAHAEGDILEIPPTDIELVLDTSKKMGETLYTRKYRNLETYKSAYFDEYDLGDVTHDNLYDEGDASGGSGFFDWIINLVGNAGDLFLQRTFKYNKYIEDPFAPGTYVYLHQVYSSEMVIDWGDTGYKNYYSYYFTSSNGKTYKTDPIPRVYDTLWVPTLLSILGSPVSSLTFYEEGNPSNTLSPITKVYKRKGDTSENAQDNPALVKNLLQYGTNNPNTTRLYIKDRNNQYQPVTLETLETGKWYRFATTIDGIDYVFETGNKTANGNLGMYQGFRHYIKDANGEYYLDTTEGVYNWLSTTLYVKEQNDQEVTALQAMQEALEDFLISAHEKANKNNGNVHIGLTVYNKRQTNDGTRLIYSINPSASNYINVKRPVGTKSIDEMIRTIYDLTAANTYASQVDLGMDVAYADMNQYKKTNSKRYTLLFTNGMPVKYVYLDWGSLGDTDLTTKLLGNVYFNVDVADKAIATAKNFKTKLNSTVYSVGLFDNADEDKLYGKYWYYQVFDKIECFGKQNQYWGNSSVSGGIAFLTGYSLDPKDAYATNRMLAYISSDFTTPSNLGVSRNTYSPGRSWITSLVASGVGYKINTSTYNYDQKGYYFGISPNTMNEDQESDEFDPIGIDVSARLAEVFKELDVVTSIPKATLDDTAVLLDSVTKYFDLVDGTVHAYDAPRGSMTGTELTGDNVQISNDVVRVKGFNYMEHWYNDDTGLSSADPRHVVVTFDITRREGLIGGNSIPSNLKSSAIYDGTETLDPDNHDGVLVEQFNIPKVDVSLKMEDTRVQDQTAYYATEQNLAQLLNPVWLDGERNEFVKLEYTLTSGDDTLVYKVPAGQSEGTWYKNNQKLNPEDLDDFQKQMLETKDYTVTCRIIPDPTGTIQPKDMSSETATVFVYAPKVTVEDDRANTDQTYPVYSDPVLTWQLDEKGSSNTYTEDQRTAAEARLNNLIIPEVNYTIVYEDNQSSTVSNVKYSYVTDPQDANQKIYAPTYNPSTNTQIPQETDFQVINVTVTPNTIYYEVEGTSISYYTTPSSQTEAPTLMYIKEVETTSGRTVWYNADGTVYSGTPDVSGLTAADPEDILISKELNRNPVNASDRDDVIHYNTSSNSDTDGVFTISPYSHDVIITNETVGFPGDPDYSDKTKEFPLTLTLMDGNNGYNGTVSYTIGDDTTEHTLSFTNGVAQSTIDLADEEYVTLKGVTHGYTLTVTSNPNDDYLVAYQEKVGTATIFTPVENVDEDEETATLTVSDNMAVKVTHSIHQIVITGLNAKSKLNPFLIAAGIVALAGGAWLGLTQYKRKKEQELAAYQAGKNE